MRFSPSFLDEIRARLPVSEVVRRRVKLKKQGREFVGLSPFGQERTPSFFVNDAKMAWFDFSSGKNGNVFDFVMQTEGLSFPEAVERLAGEAGLPLPTRSPESEQRESRRAGLMEVLEWAAACFERELAGPRGAEARAYLDGRGIGADSRRAFRIGYATPARHALRDALAARGASVETMCEAGLLSHGAEIPVPYDSFRDRVMFPITDRSGKVIAFGGRALRKDVAAKYKNSPETPVFSKGRVLFNHHAARKAAHERGRVVAVEGYIDVVAMHAAGFPETVAGLGTALTPEQAGLLWTMAPQPVLCFDGDKAGIKAAARAAEMALPLIEPNRTLAFALLPDGQDPDELIRAAGPAAIEQALAEALPLVELLWDRTVEGRALHTPEQRVSLKRDLDAAAGAIRDEDLRRHYRAEFDRRLGELFGFAAPAADRGRQGHGRGQYGSAQDDGRGGARFQAGHRRGRAGAPERQGYLSAPPAVASPGLAQRLQRGRAALPPREALILLILLAHPDLVDEHAEELASLDFDRETAAGRELAALRDRLLDMVHETAGADEAAPAAGGEGLRAGLAAAGFGPLLGRLDAGAGGHPWYLRAGASPVDAASVLRQALTLHHRAGTLHRELISAQEALALDLSDANMARMRDIREQISALAGAEAAIEGFGSASGRTAVSI